MIRVRVDIVAECDTDSETQKVDEVLTGRGYDVNVNELEKKISFTFFQELDEDNI